MYNLYVRVYVSMCTLNRSGKNVYPANSLLLQVQEEEVIGIDRSVLVVCLLCNFHIGIKMEMLVIENISGQFWY